MCLKLGDKMKIYKGALVFCILFAFTACSLFSKSIIQGEVLGNTSGLKRDEESRNALIYVRPGYNIGEYRKFRIDPVLTKSIGKDMSGLSANDKKTLAEYLRKAVRKELSFIFSSAVRGSSLTILVMISGYCICVNRDACETESIVSRD